MRKVRIFLCLEGYLKKHNISFGNITAVTTNGTPAMIGHYRGFATLDNEKVPNVGTVYYVLHRPYLVAKKLHNALKVYIRSINKIKAHPLNSWLFAMLYEKNNETLN